MVISHKRGLCKYDPTSLYSTHPSSTRLSMAAAGPPPSRRVLVPVVVLVVYMGTTSVPGGRRMVTQQERDGSWTAVIRKGEKRYLGYGATRCGAVKDCLAAFTSEFSSKKS